MKTMEKPPSLIQELQQLEVFSSLPANALQWLVDRSDYVRYEVGDLLYYPGKPVDHMLVIVKGRYLVELEQGGDLQEVGVYETGHLTGVLPFSRMTESRAYGRALDPCLVLELHRSHFTEMVNVSYALTQALVQVMTSRVRDFTSQRFQTEKLMALGKLSAGLAHELNNPAAAMVRSAEDLYKHHHKTPEKFKDVITMRISPQQTDQVNAILFERLKNLDRGELSTIQRMDRMDELLDWLEDHGIVDGDDLAETFVDFEVTTDDLDQIMAIIGSEGLPTILWWMESTLSMEKLLCDIKASAIRISSLIQSIKQYSHMDRGVSTEAVDIHKGIRSTLVMLQHALKKKKINLVVDFDESLPQVKGFPGELNQVWTNLIVNAIDAMNDAGTLRLKTFRERRYACVEVTDSGAGIPEENLTSIFDPFFTTKPMGEGTGMGLDIVKRIADRHKATIDVRSRPGKTTFKLCFPIDRP